MSTNAELYEQDVYAWAQTTAALLRAGKWHEVDTASVAEEIESVGASQYAAVSSTTYQILVHLLKWCYQPQRRSQSWQSSLVEHRNRVPRRLRRLPSLAREIPTMILEEYPAACRKATAQTGLPLATWLCRKLCSGSHAGAVAPVCGGMTRPGSRTVRPQ